MDWLRSTLPVLFDADWLSLVTWLGLLATIAGFWFTLVQVFRARRASEAAREASRRTAEMLRTQRKIAESGYGHAEILHARKFIMVGQMAAADHALRRVHRLCNELKGETKEDVVRSRLIDECIHKIEKCLEEIMKPERVDQGLVNTNLTVVERYLGQFIGEDRAKGENNV